MASSSTFARCAFGTLERARFMSANSGGRRRPFSFDLSMNLRVRLMYQFRMNGTFITVRLIAPRIRFSDFSSPLTAPGTSV
jgi:hypothetical protein